jgi:hypothetical protein
VTLSDERIEELIGQVKGGRNRLALARLVFLGKVYDEMGESYDELLDAAESVARWAHDPEILRARLPALRDAIAKVKGPSGEEENLNPTAVRLDGEGGPT